jgi:hypothetical protein
MIGLTKKPNAIKCSDHCTVSPNTHTAKTVARVLRRRIESRTEDVLGEDQSGFKTGKGTRDATGILKIVSE